MRSLFICVAATFVLLVSCSRDNGVPGGSGMIEANDVVISSEVSGRVVALHFDEGDNIKAGESIALIDTVTISLKLNQAYAAKLAAVEKEKMSSISIEQAEFNLALAKKELDRFGALIKSGSINQQQFDQAETAFKQASLSKQQAIAARDGAEADLQRIESEIALLQKQISDSRPISPISGTVITKFIDPGELITPGRPLIKIAQLETVWVKIYLPPADLTKIKLGGTASVDPEDGSGKTFEGKISWIADQAEFTPKNVQTKEARADLIYAVKVVIPNPDRNLKIGMPVSVKIKP